MRYSVVLISLAIAIRSFGQDRPSSMYEKGRLLIGPVVTIASIQGFSNKFGIGVSSEYFLGHNFSFAGAIAGGPDYAELSGSMVGLLGFAGGTGVLLLPLVIENPCFHFQPVRNHNFALLFNLLKFRYIFEKNSYYGMDNLFASTSITLRYTIFGQKELAVVFLC